MKLNWFIISSTLACTGCEKNINTNIEAVNEAITPANLLEKSIAHHSAELEIFPEAGESALSEPLKLLGVLVAPDKKLVLVLDQEAKARMGEVTSADSAQDSLLTVKVNGIFIDQQRNISGWTGGVVVSGSVSGDILSALRSKGIKMVEIEHSMFTPYEDYVELLEVD